MLSPVDFFPDLFEFFLFPRRILFGIVLDIHSLYFLNLASKVVILSSSFGLQVVAF